MPPRRDTTNSIHSGHGGRFEAAGLANRTTSIARAQRLMEINAAYAREHEERVRAAAASVGARAAADSARYARAQAERNEAKRAAAAQDEKMRVKHRAKNMTTTPPPSTGLAALHRPARRRVITAPLFDAAKRFHEPHKRLPRNL